MLTDANLWTLRERLEHRTRAELDNPRSRRAAVLVPLLGSQDAPELLCFQRTHDVLEHKGEICFPGGSFEPHDDGPIDAALREAEEELNLRRDDVEIIGMLDDVETVVSNYTITPVVGFIAGLPELRPDTLEVSRVIYVPLARLIEPGVEATESLEDSGIGKLRYSYTFEGNRIWGATGRIVRCLVDVLRGR